MREQRVCLTAGGCREGGKAAWRGESSGKGGDNEKGLNSRETWVGGEIKGRFSEMAGRGLFTDRGKGLGGMGLGYLNRINRGKGRTQGL